jgi:hypothetical protein
MAAMRPPVWLRFAKVIQAVVACNTAVHMKVNAIRIIVYSLQYYSTVTRNSLIRQMFD